MKTLRKLFCALVLLMCVCSMVLPAAATVSEYEGLEVTGEMDKESYEKGEAITATITVTNTNTYAVTIVNLEQLIPEGYVLSEGSEVSKENVVLAAGETMTLQVTYEGESTETEGEEGFLDKLLYGTSLGLPNLLWVVLLVIAFIIYMLLT